VSVFVATIVTMVAAGVETKTQVVNEVTKEVSFREGFLAVTNIIFAYRMSNISSGRVHPTTFPFPIRPKDLSC
jgi:hypothetical protein